MLDIMLLGGWMMWPLLFVSIVMVALIIERLLFFGTHARPDLSKLSLSELVEKLKQQPEFYPFIEALEHGDNDETLSSIAQDIVNAREKHLSMLATLSKIAPLMGLLGTIFGMIETFSIIASMSGSLNMTILAQGIWQALITTATGLIIAIPGYLFLAYFRSQVSITAQYLIKVANLYRKSR